MRRLWKVLLGCGSLLILYTLVGFLVLPPVLKRIAEKRYSEMLHRSVTIGEIHTNPFILSLRANRIEVRDEPGGEAVASIGEIYLNLEALSAVKRAWVVKELRIQDPLVRLIRLEGGRYNVSDLLEAEEPKAPGDPSARGATRFAVHNIQLLNGRVEFVDRPVDTTHVIDDLDIRVPFLSTLDVDVETWVKPVIRAIVDGSPLAVEGRTRPFSPTHEAVLTVAAQGIDVSRYLPYVPVQLEVEVPSGTLDVNADVSFSQSPDEEPSLMVEGSATLSGLKVVDPQEAPILSLAALDMSGLSFQPFKGNLRIADISVQAPALRLSRSEKGVFNVAELADARSSAGGNAAATEAKTHPTERTPFVWSVGRVVVSDGSIDFTDRSTRARDAAAEPQEQVSHFRVKADRIQVAAAHLSPFGEGVGSITLSSQVGEGTVTAEGSIRFNPLALDLKVGAEKVDVTPVQWYFPDDLHLRLDSGRLQLHGNLQVSAAEDDRWRMLYTGDVSFAELATTRPDGDPWVSWQRLDLEHVRGESDPARVVLETATLSGLDTHVRIAPDGSLNLMDAWAKPADSSQGAPQTPGDEERAITLRVDKLLLRDGSIAFSDLHITPSVAAKLIELNGTLAGLSTEAATESRVTISGRSDQGAPLKIEGTVGPLSDTFFMKLTASFEHVDLTRLDPYARRHVGYSLERGNLSMDLDYQIVEKKLKAGNKFLLDQVVLGERVKSPQATALPVKFALALLKDRHGKVRLNVPVSGDLGDPQFDFGEAVARAVRGLFRKIVSAPFAFFASLVGARGDELQHIDFEPGSASVPRAERDQLDKVIAGLYERPQLGLEIQGHFDPAADAEALRQDRLDRTLRLRKRKDLLAQGADVALESVSLSSEERERYLNIVYQEEIATRDDRPENEDAAAEGLSSREMEQALLAQSEIGTEDLRLLAQRRALNVKAYLLDSRKIDAGRIFLLQPSAKAGGDREDHDITLTLS